MFAIPNCDTVKKARTFLADHHVNYEFIDFKKKPPTHEQINAWSDYLGELPVNKKGLTYRKFKDSYETLSAPEKIDFIIANPSIIKRPILVKNGKTMAVGYDEAQYKDLLSTNL